MQLNFVGKNIEITSAIKTFVTEKFKVLEKRYSTINNINIVLHIENITHIAEATLHLNGVEVHAKAKADDMYKAIEELVDKLVGQLSKQKDKMSSHH